MRGALPDDVVGEGGGERSYHSEKKRTAGSSCAEDPGGFLAAFPRFLLVESVHHQILDNQVFQALAVAALVSVAFLTISSWNREGTFWYLRNSMLKLPLP